ncbi:MAG: NfeD family protein [Bacillota bacterium]|nr:NfeD family protein [Bacillota bacterium]HHU62391.1 NfeD family protein [Natronincola sp.]
MVWIWLALGILFLILEALTSNFFLLWFACGSFVGALISKLGLSFEWQFGVFVISSGILLLLSRTVFVKFFLLRSGGRHVRTNVDSLIGKRGLIKNEVESKLRTGEVLIEGSLYGAISSSEEKLSVDSEVKVVGIQGNKLIVELLERG